MITLRQKVFMIVSVLVAILLAILLYILYGSKGQTVNNNTNNPTQTSSTVNGVETINQAEQVVDTLPPYSEDLYVRQLAKIFVERFGSNSSQTPNQNITDSIELATASMQTWLKSQMKAPTRDYVGEVTEVLASRLSEKTATNATVAIEAQQTVEAKKDGAVGATNREIKQRKGRVTLVKTGNDWLVDGLYWDN